MMSYGVLKGLQASSVKRHGDAAVKRLLGGGIDWLDRPGLTFSPVDVVDMRGRRQGITASCSSMMARSSNQYAEYE